MPDIQDHVAYLSQQIGPRPAGTEEEQQAALYITEQLQKDAGLSAVIEDFSGAGNSDVPRALCCAVTALVGLLSLFLPVVVIPAVIISLIALLLLLAEVFDRPVLSKVFSRGVSQNVVAKYEPGYTAEAGGSRRRKIVLVAHYDSGKVRSELKAPIVGILPVLRWINVGAMAFVTLLLLLRATLFAQPTGMVEIVLNVLMVIALVLVLLPVIETIVHKLAAYNEAANCNASGVAVLLEVARRVGRGRVSEAELAARSADATIHGEEAARAAGLVPEGVQIVYASANVKPPEIAPQSEAARLAAAKAAVAALTGAPVSMHHASDLADNLVKVKEPPLLLSDEDQQHALRDETREAFMTIPPETIQEALEHAQVPGAADGAQPSSFSEAVENAAPAPSYSSANHGASAASEDGVPAWFKAAQEKAKKPADDSPVHRSRYAEALDAAQAEAANNRVEEPPAMSELEYRLQSIHEGIREVKAPQAMRGLQEADQEATALGADGAAAVANEPYEGLADDAQGAAAGGNEPVREQQLAPQLADATSAMSPIDVSDLRPGSVPAQRDVPMPAFLDPANIQAQTIAARGEVDRTPNRVDVTGASIGGSGRIELPGTGAQLDVQQLEDQSAQGLEDASAARSAVNHRPIVLPDIGLTSPGMAPLTELPKQRAPLAEAEKSGKTAAKSLLNMLPSIEPNQAGAAGGVAGNSIAEATDSSSVPRADLRTMLPSLSGAIPRQEDSTVSAAGAFVPAGATGAFAPVGDELLENVHPEDIYVDDADDSSFEGEYTESGAFTGPGYVEMPKSRAHRFMDKLRFRKRKDEQEETPQEWLEVDESFDAREAGAARGGWESFREQDEMAGEEFIDEGSQAQAAPLFQNDFVSPIENVEAPYNFEEDTFVLDDVAEGDYDDTLGGRQGRWNGGAFSRQHMDQVSGELESDFAGIGAELEPHVAQAEVASELQQIYQFRNPDINTEVWFVALGSELAQHGGMNAFLAEHNQDLRGSIIIDIEALGAGQLCMIEREGTYRKVKASSRMKRYTKKASQATGLSIQTGSMLWGDSSASVAIKQGFQAMHLAGMDGLKPAFFAQGDDVLENIDEASLNDNADFVMELLKNI